MPDSGTGEFAGLTGENGIHIDPDGEALLGTRLQDRTAPRCLTSRTTLAGRVGRCRARVVSACSAWRRGHFGRRGFLLRSRQAGRRLVGVVIAFDAQVDAAGASFSQRT